MLTVIAADAHGNQAHTRAPPLTLEPCSGPKCAYEMHSRTQETHAAPARVRRCRVITSRAIPACWCSRLRVQSDQGSSHDLPSRPPRASLCACRPPRPETITCNMRPRRPLTEPCPGPMLFLSILYTSHTTTDTCGPVSLRAAGCRVPETLVKATPIYLYLPSMGNRGATRGSRDESSKCNLYLNNISF